MPREALAPLPDDLRSYMSDVAILVEDEALAGMPVLGPYQGVPVTRRGSADSGLLRDKITI